MDPYSTLGVPKSASYDEIKKAYRRLAMQYHPDRNSDPSAEEKFKRISEAHALIGDPESRRKFDAQSSRPTTGASGPKSNPPPGFDDFFRQHGGFGSWEDFIGGRFRNTRPYIVKSKVDVTLEELKTGTEKVFTMDGKSVSFRIPKGCSPGITIRVGLDSGQELHARVDVLPHELFELKGSDLYGHVEVPVDVALKGGEVRAPTLDGVINLKIPPRTSSHSKLRVRSAGMKYGQEPAGSIIYEVKITLKKISPELLSWANSFS
jgi:curved DNA-binding protein